MRPVRSGISSGNVRLWHRAAELGDAAIPGADSGTTDTSRVLRLYAKLTPGLRIPTARHHVAEFLARRTH